VEKSLKRVGGAGVRKGGEQLQGDRVPGDL